MFSGSPSKEIGTKEDFVMHFFQNLAESLRWQPRFPGKVKLFPPVVTYINLPPKFQLKVSWCNDTLLCSKNIQAARLRSQVEPMTRGYGRY